MITIVCDACKKAIPNAQSGKNLIFIRDKMLCLSCDSDLEAKTRVSVSKNRTYTLTDFQNNYLANLRKMCS
jgi:hypothetical protein